MEPQGQPLSPKPKIRPFLYNPIVVVISALLLFFASQLISAILAQPLLLFVRNQNFQLVIYMGLNLIALLVGLGIAKIVFKFSWTSLGFRLPKLQWIGLVVPGFLLYLMVSTGLTLLVTHLIPSFNMNQTQDVGFDHLTKLPELLAAFVSLVVITPLVEETIFRGILFRGIRKKTPFWLSAILTSVLFAAAHLQWNVAIDVFSLSLVMCFLVEKSNSIIPTILLHAMKNGLAFIFLFIIK